MVVIAIVAVLFASLSFGPATQAASLDKIIIAYVSLGVRVTPLWIAQEQNFFAKQGVPSELVWINAAPLSVTALYTGDAQVALTAGSGPLNAAMDKDDLRVFAGLVNKAGLDLVTRPEIKTPADLRGKRLGVQSIGGGNWMQALLGLERLGMDTQRDDIRVTVSGGQRVLIQALETGAIDAAALDVPFSRQLKAKGFNVLLELAKVDIPIMSLAFIAKKSFIQEQPEKIEGIVKAVIEGITFLIAPKNKRTVIASLMKHLRTSDPTVAEEGYQDLLRSIDRRAYPSIEGLRNIQRLMKNYNPKLGKIKVEELVDERILRKLDANGFTDRIHRTYGGQ